MKNDAPVREVLTLVQGRGSKKKVCYVFEGEKEKQIAPRQMILVGDWVTWSEALPRDLRRALGREPMQVKSTYTPVPSVSLPWRQTLRAEIVAVAPFSQKKVVGQSRHFRVIV